MTHLERPVRDGQRCRARCGGVRQDGDTYRHDLRAQRARQATMPRRRWPWRTLRWAPGAPRVAAGSAAVTLLVTGATGFVMSVLVREWLRADPAAQRRGARCRATRCGGFNGTSSPWQPADAGDRGSDAAGAVGGCAEAASDHAYRARCHPFTPISRRLGYRGAHRALKRTIRRGSSRSTPWERGAARLGARTAGSAPFH